MQARLLLIVVMAAVFTGCSEPSGGAMDVGAFLERHWQEPLPPQGAPPAGFTDIEASLAPENCGTCHEDQWRQWQTSLHHQTMGPGIQWQLRLMDQTEGNKCLRCHAPLAEQKALVALQQGWPGAPASKPPAYVSDDLADQGLVCAACHVRQHQRFGPPPNKPVEEPVPHGGFTVADAYEDSRFCSKCHQFPEDWPRVNGKLNEDTYNQWLASPQARNNETCQSCHMPDRQHLFRGIHDPEMVRKAIDVRIEIEPQQEDETKGLARVVIRNTGAGHHFPTYMVPKVNVSLLMYDPQGGSQIMKRGVIGWGVDLELTEEYFDTRIPAGGEYVLEQLFQWPEGAGWEIGARLHVMPGEQYERKFRSVLQQAGALEADVVARVQQALEKAEQSRFEALALRKVLPERIAN